VRVFDPAGMSQAKTVLKNVDYCDSAYECADGADALVIATEWEQFRALDLEQLRDIMACRVVVDLRNIYRPEDMSRHGFAYSSVGRQANLCDASPEGMPLANARARAPSVRLDEIRRVLPRGQGGCGERALSHPIVPASPGLAELFLRVWPIRHTI
jgi:UDP-glucose/GDP-mannose dehydrogenase family, UDP binding domain